MIIAEIYSDIPKKNHPIPAYKITAVKISFFEAAKNSIPFSRLKPITKKDPESKLSESLKIIIFNRRSKNYSMIVATLPDPTVRPPSRIAKDNP